MTLEQKWDLLWPLSCAVTHAIERYDNGNPHTSRAPDRETLLHMCRELKKAVDYISESNERLSQPNGDPK